MHDRSLDYEAIEDVIEDVLISANKFGIVELVATLENVISANIQDSNVESLLQVAEACGFNRLKSSCLSYQSSKKPSSTLTIK